MKNEHRIVLSLTSSILCIEESILCKLKLIITEKVQL